MNENDKPDPRIRVGDKVVDSPIGPGHITDFSDRGFPRVDGVSVAWCVFEDGSFFDPYGMRKGNQ